MSDSHKKRFEEVRVRVFDHFAFKRGASAFLPGLGIVIGKSEVNDIDLLRHEYGHYLQLKALGWIAFWRYVALTSFFSYRRSWKKGASCFDHYKTWTEWSANRLSWEHFGRPADWNMLCFPISAPNTHAEYILPAKFKDSFDKIVSDYGAITV